MRILCSMAEGFPEELKWCSINLSVRLACCLAKSVKLSKWLREHLHFAVYFVVEILVSEDYLYLRKVIFTTETLGGVVNVFNVCSNVSFRICHSTAILIQFRYITVINIVDKGRVRRRSCAQLCL